MVAALLSLAAGCGDESHAPSAPPSDGAVRGTEPPGAGRRDSGVDGGRTDGGGLGDAGVASCEIIDPDDPSNFLQVTQGGVDTGFELERAFVQWNGDCEAPRLLIGLTDGACDPGEGEQLLLSIDPEEVGVTVVVGENVLSSEPTPLGVRFSRPLSADARELFGTCSGASEGFVSFVAVGTETDAREAARFENVLLGNCGDPESAPVSVTGAFDLGLPVALAGVCP